LFILFAMLDCFASLAMTKAEYPLDSNYAGLLRYARNDGRWTCCEVKLLYPPLDSNVCRIVVDVVYYANMLQNPATATDAFASQ
jgi:hypothetical protein